MTAIVLAISSAIVACDGDDDSDGSSGGSDQSVGASAGEPDDRSNELACKVGAKTVELIGARLRRGSTARQIVEDVGPGLESGCEVAVKVFDERPQASVDLTIVNPDGSTLAEQVTGSALTRQAPATSNTGPADCTNYTTYALFDLCIQLKVAALSTPATR